MNGYETEALFVWRPVHTPRLQAERRCFLCAARGVLEWGYDVQCSASNEGVVARAAVKESERDAINSRRGRRKESPT